MVNNVKIEVNSISNIEVKNIDEIEGIDGESLDIVKQNVLFKKNTKKTVELDLELLRAILLQI